MYLSAAQVSEHPARAYVDARQSPSQKAAKSARPVFRFECQGGCTQFPSIFCETILQRAIVNAIKLAETAARLLAADPRDSATIGEFQAIFGYPPSRPQPWPDVNDYGVRVANRYRIAARALQKGGTLYRCHPCPPGSAAEYPGAIVDANAWALLDHAGVPKPPNEVLLCPTFWLLSPPLQAGVILHEMFHLRFDPSAVHGPCETKRTNAHCYEALALRLSGFTPEKSDVARCHASPY